MQGVDGPDQGHVGPVGELRRRQAVAHRVLDEPFRARAVPADQQSEQSLDQHILAHDAASMVRR